MRFFFSAVVLALVACGSSDDGGGTTPSNTTPTEDAGGGGGGQTDSGPKQDPQIVKTTNESVDVGGTAHTYILAVPVTYDASKKYPLVMELHGDGEQGAAMQKAYPFEAASGQEAIVVYPNGGGNPGWDLYTAADQNQDFAFLSALVTSLAGKYNIDTTKVLATGYSSGAFMVNQIACKIPGLVRAIAPNEGGAPADDFNGAAPTCTNNSPVAVFAFHGDADGTVDVMSGRYETQFWATRNGCDPNAREDIDPQPCKKASNCTVLAPVTYCEIPGQDHIVWNRANEVSWKYFKAL